MSCANSKTYPCMWFNTGELTDYKGYGYEYECAHGGSGVYIAIAENALNGWKDCKPKNDMISNQGIWKNQNWSATGVGILNG